jgi:hypothetical protein
MDTQFSKIEKYENWISEFNVRLQDTYKKMRAIDNNNIFSRDDEVGVAFTQILNLIESIKDKVK